MNLDDGIQIGNADAVVWLVAAVIVVLAWSVANAQRRRARTKFATGDRVDDVFQLRDRNGIAGVSRAILSVLAIVLLILGLMDWRWGKTRREVPQKGIEIMFLLDVSRSMLAQDATPSRLERAKQMIRDMVGAMAGDRVGLVAFAGETRRIIPVTNHYEDFITTLADVGPDSLRRGGSRLGDAIQAGGDGFLSKTNSHRVMIVLTDGEDQESEPVRMAEQLHQQEGIRVFTIGLGDMSAGAKIPNEETQRYVRYQGEPVVTKLNGEILEQVARVSQGAYVPAGTKQVDMKAVYDRYIAGIEKTDFETVKIDAYEARFQWFAFPALAILFIEALMTGRRGVRRPGRAATAMMMILAWSSFGNSIGNHVVAQTIPSAVVNDEYSIYNQGVAAYQSDELDAAIGLFDQAAGAVDQRIAAAARYNAGTARIARVSKAIESGQTDEARKELVTAITSLRSALRLRPRWQDARANLERAVRMLDQLSSQQQDQQQQDQKQEDEQQQDEQQQDEQQQDEQQQDEQQQDEQQQDQQQQDQQQQDQQQQDQQSKSDQSDQPGENKKEPENKSEPEDTGEPENQDANEGDPQPSSDPQGQLQSDQEADERMDAEPTESVQPAEPTEMTEEEAQKMLQAVRDRDMIRRFRQQQLNRMRQVPVEKDW